MWGRRPPRPAFTVPDLIEEGSAQRSQKRASRPSVALTEPLDCGHCPSVGFVDAHALVEHLDRHCRAWRDEARTVDAERRGLRAVVDRLVRDGQEALS